MFFFIPEQKVTYNLYSPLVLADQILQQSQGCKYLGVYIDSSCSKISKNLVIIRKNCNIITRLKRYLTSNLLVPVYHSVIYPYLYYAYLLLRNNYDPLSEVVKLQNKAFCIIDDVPFYGAKSSSLCTVGLRLLKAPNIVKLSTCLLFYENLDGDKISSFSVTLH